MQSKLSKSWVRARIALRQNRGALVFVLAWLTVNTVLFVRASGMDAGEALLVALCVGKVDHGWPAVYQPFTQAVVFGVIASMVVANVTSRYRPEATCRALAAQARGHVVVVGYTNLGRRVRELVAEAGRSVVVVEPDPAEVAELLRAEAPVVVGSPRDRATLEAAGVAHAKVVVVATDDLEAAVVACRLVRDVNAACELVVRCPDDDVGAVLSKTYRARVVSTSKLAASFVHGVATRVRARSVVVLGDNDVGRRVRATLEEHRVRAVLAESTEDPARLVALGVPDADLVVLCEDDLGKNLIRVDRVRDVSARAKIVCRAFHEDAAAVLTRAPFGCTVLSTSRHAAASLVRAGVFREVGIDDARPIARPTAAAA